MKIESKLFSELRGRMAELAAQMRRGKMTLSKLGIPYHISGAERSTSQKAIWQRYGKIVEDWSKLSPAEKAVYTAQGALIQISGWNAYVQKNMIWDGLDGWSEKKVATISGSTAGEQTNFQMRVKAWKGTGTSSGENVYLDADVRDDFGDVRFTKDDGQTLYNYWLEEKVDGSYAIFWIEIPSIPIAPGTTNFWLQHGNPTATTTSNGPNTFVFFDDFNDASLDPIKWPAALGTWTESGGIITSTGISDSATLLRSSFTGINYIAFASISPQTSGQPTVVGIGILTRHNADMTNLGHRGYRSQFEIQSGTIYTTLKHAKPGVGYLSTKSYITNIGTFYKIEQIVADTSIKTYINDVLELTDTDPTYSSGYFSLITYALGNQQFDYAGVRKYASPSPIISSWL